MLQSVYCPQELIIKIFRDLKASAIYVLTYHNLLEYYGRQNDDGRIIDPKAIVVSGGLAGQQPIS